MCRHAWQITAVDAAELGFAGVGVTISDTDLAWLYNLIAAAAQGPIQDAITREVAAQVRAVKSYEGVSCKSIVFLPKNS